MAKKKVAKKAVKKKVAKKKATKKAVKKKVAKKKATKKAVKKKVAKKKATKKSAKKKLIKKVAPTRKPNEAFMRPLKPSAALSQIVGEEPIPRTEIVKRLWAYIKKHKLQDPSNKRNIKADDKLRKVFKGKKVVSMFEMTKLVADHLE